MRTGAAYRDSLRDGRDVWVLGYGRVDDVTTHAATAAMVEEYVAWYDRHVAADWQDILLTAPATNGERRPLAFEIPTTSAHLRQLGKAIAAVHFLTAGNMTHTPGYGALIALGLLDVVKRLHVSPAEVEAAEAYRDSLACHGRFLTFASGGPLIGQRFRAEAQERVALRLISETADGIVVRGKVSMHTSTPFAEDVLITGRDEMPPGSGRWLWFIMPVNAPGVRVVTRPPAPRHANAFLSPLSSRFDELDAQLWLNDVFIPRRHVFTAEPLFQNHRHALPSWLFWHQHYGWLARAEFTLGLALALAEVMGLKENPDTIEQLTDLVVDVQTIRSCVTAAELEPEMTAAGFAVPGQLHVAAASIYTLKARQHMSEILRSLPGSSLLNAPADTDFADATMATELEEALEEAVTARGSGQRSCSSPGIMWRLAWTDARRPSNCMPTAVSRPGAGVCVPGLVATTNWPTVCTRGWAWTSPRWICTVCARSRMHRSVRSPYHRPRLLLTLWLPTAEQAIIDDRILCLCAMTRCQWYGQSVTHQALIIACSWRQCIATTAPPELDWGGIYFVLLPGVSQPSQGRRPSMDDILAVLSRTADGVYAVDREQRIVFWNTAAEQILGHSMAEVLGRSCQEIFAGQPRPGCLECGPHCPVMISASRHEPVPTYNLLTRTKAGDPILLNVSVVVPPDNNGQFVTIHLFRDATHQLRYESYVEQILCAAARLPSPQATLSRSAHHTPPLGAPLSGREKEVLYLLVQGKGARHIADTLCISYATVRNHLQTILRKLGVHSQREAVKIALEHRLV